MLGADPRTEHLVRYTTWLCVPWDSYFAVRWTFQIVPIFVVVTGTERGIPSCRRLVSVTASMQPWSRAPKNPSTSVASSSRRCRYLLGRIAFARDFFTGGWTCVRKMALTISLCLQQENRGSGLGLLPKSLGPCLGMRLSDGIWELLFASLVLMDYTGLVQHGLGAFGPSD